MLALEEYYLLMALTEMGKRRAEFITKIRSMSAMLKPRSYVVEQILDNNGEKIVLRVPDGNIPDVKAAEGHYLESLSVLQYWIKRLNVRDTLISYPEFKSLFLETSPRWQDMAVNKMISKLKDHLNEHPLIYDASQKDMKSS